MQRTSRIISRTAGNQLGHNPTGDVFCFVFTSLLPWWRVRRVYCVEQDKNSGVRQFPGVRRQGPLQVKRARLTHVTWLKTFLKERRTVWDLSDGKLMTVCVPAGRADWAGQKTTVDKVFPVETTGPHHETAACTGCLTGCSQNPAHDKPEQWTRW